MSAKDITTSFLPEGGISGSGESKENSAPKRHRSLRPQCTLRVSNMGATDSIHISDTNSKVAEVVSEPDVKIGSSERDFFDHPMKNGIVRFNRVIVDGKPYAVPAGKEYREIRCGETLFGPGPIHTKSPYSDHPLLSGIDSGSGIRIGTFNAMLTVLAHRGYENLCNDISCADSRWIGMSTGDELSIDQTRREFVVDYIVTELERLDILMIQEIDLKAIELLTDHGVKVAYSQESLINNRGGCAICTKQSHVTFSNVEAIFDSWDFFDKRKKRDCYGKKHVGTYAIATYEKNGKRKEIALTSFHLDADTHAEIVTSYATRPLSFVGGDFNTNVSKLRVGTRLTGDDRSRPCGTIDAVFKLAHNGKYSPTHLWASERVSRVDPFVVNINS